MADLELALNFLGQSALNSRFVQEKVDGRQILTMSDKDLINLGVVSLGDRLRLREMKENQEFQHGPRGSGKRLRFFLGENCLFANIFNVVQKFV